MTSKKGQKPAVIRDTNIKLIMQLLYSKSSSRSDLAASTKLSNPALTKIIDQLLGIGFVKEGAEIETNCRGRRKVDLVVNSDFASVVGIDFSSDNIRILLVNFAKEIIASREIADSEIITKEVLNKVVETLKEVLFLAKSPVKCICIGVPGKINADTGKVQMASYKYRDCRDINIVEFFENRFKIPTVIANDASLQMLAEKQRTGVNTDSALIYNDYGMGGALWFKGEAFESDSGFAGELGAIPVIYNGETVIFEDICSINAMLYACGYELNNSASFVRFLSAYKSGGAAEVKAVNKSAHGVALLIRSILGVTGCRDIIINGKICNFGEPYLDDIRRYIAEEKIFDIKKLQVRYGYYSDSGTVTGAIEKALEYVINNEVARR